MLLRGRPRFVSRETWALRSLLAPTKPTEKTFEQLVAVLTEHYSPLPPEAMQRYRFNSRSRQPGESVAAFVADLRRLAEHCEFGTALNKMLRDRLLHGINDERIRDKLLQEKNLTQDRAIAIAQGVESATKNLQEMKAPTKPDQVHKVFRRRHPPVGKDVTCHRCGVPGHLCVGSGIGPVIQGASRYSSFSCGSRSGSNVYGQELVK